MRHYKYSQAYQESHDIDYFVKFGRRNYHIASNGGSIPNVITIKKNNSSKAIAYNRINKIWGEESPRINIATKYGRLIAYDETHRELGPVFLTKYIWDCFFMEAGRPPETEKEVSDFICSFFQMAIVGYVSIYRLSHRDKYIMICSPYYSPNPDDRYYDEDTSNSDLVEYDLSTMPIINYQEMISPWQSYMYRENG